MAFPFRYKTSTHTFQLNLSVKKLDKSDLRLYVPLEASPCTFGTNSVTSKRESSSDGASALVFSENRFDDMLRAFGREAPSRYETPMSLRKKLRLKVIYSGKPKA